MKRKERGGAGGGRKRLAGMGLALSLLVCLCLPVGASGVGVEMPEDYQSIPLQLPESVAELLPEGVDSSDPEEAMAAVAELISPEKLLSVVAKVSGVELRQSIRLLARLGGLLVIAAVLNALQSSLGSSALSGAVRFCTTTAIFAAIIHTQMEQLRGVVTFFERLSSLMGAMIPITGTIWAMGGNVTTASAGVGTLSVFLTVCETLCARSVMPLTCFLTALALCNTLSPEAGMRGLTGAVKKTYTFSIGMTMTILLASLSAQTTLTAAADSTTARAAKVVSSTVIPMVGGSVGETLRTVASGVGYLKSVVGIGGIVFLFLLTLPTLLTLILTRLAFLLSGGAAELLGCDSESRLLSELGTVWGCIIAAVAMSAVMFILGLTIFVRSTVAAL